MDINCNWNVQHKNPTHPVTKSRTITSKGTIMLEDGKNAETENAIWGKILAANNDIAYFVDMINSKVINSKSSNSKIRIDRQFQNCHGIYPYLDPMCRCKPTTQFLSPWVKDPFQNYLIINCIIWQIDIYNCWLQISINLHQP